MKDKKMPEKLNKTDFKNIVVLSAVILAAGICLMMVTVLISKDGTLYIDYAKLFEAKGLAEALQSMRGCGGYPFMVYLMHSVLGIFEHTDSLQRWIFSAQAVSLCSKLAASILLYFTGSCFVGRRLAFWGVLVLNVLPDAAELGCDALTDWPHLMFLAAGFLMLLLGTRASCVWMFGLAAVAAALAYMVRSEGCQLLFYGGLWLIFNLVRPQGKMSRPKAVFALILLAVGFAAVLPYMKLTGYVLPRQKLFRLADVTNANVPAWNCQDNVGFTAGIMSGKVMGNKNLIKNICETLIYYFVPLLFVGLWCYFRRQSKAVWQKFYPAAFIAFNTAILLFYTSWHYIISRRHSFPLVAFTIFYAAVGAAAVSKWVSIKFGKDRRQWFFILLTIGIILCLAKVTNRCAMQKYGYRETADWLRKNTTAADVIAVPDRRIAFYAERNWIDYSDAETISEPVDYIVQIISGSNVQKPGIDRDIQQVYSTWADKSRRKRVVIWSIR